MKHHIDKARESLGDLAGLSAKTEAAEKRILEAAQQRLEAVQTEIKRSRKGVEFGPDKAQERYLALIKERGQLQSVIARSEEALQ